MRTEAQKKKHREYMREWQKKHPGYNVANVKQWREKTPGVRAREYKMTGAEYSRRWKAKLTPAELKAHHKKADLKKYYGMTLEEYEHRFAKQGGVCAICKMSDSSGRRLAVDHNHNCCPGKKSCGKCIRGLLCSPCNHALGRFDAVANFAVAATIYMEEYPMPPSLDPDIYGNDPANSKANAEANRALGNPDPTMDVNGETDDRAKSEGNHGKQP
jgi:hypothetical protein